ncbi:hypothetical protein MATL_G00222280 [Megalops atlanticus]|uniref:Enamelin n=1 Tax=Megalops atlanticus TaxID=7932 RepID=A0A9D3PGB8_MEGAT|nr:hypothetical protein MATL_G00222280 [Megalops atlanticus]
MKTVGLLFCVLGVTLAFPAGDSGSNEAMMQMYRFYGALQQFFPHGFSAQPAVVNPQPNPAPAAPQPPAQTPGGLFFNFPGMARMPPKGDGSEEEGGHGGFYPPYGYPFGGVGNAPPRPPNSEEEEGAEAEEAGGPEGAEGAEPADAGTPVPDVAVVEAPVEAVAVAVPSADIAVVDPADVATVAAIAAEAAAVPQDVPAGIVVDAAAMAPEFSPKGDVPLPPIVIADASPQPLP